MVLMQSLCWALERQYLQREAFICMWWYSGFCIWCPGFSSCRRQTLLDCLAQGWEGEGGLHSWILWGCNNWRDSCQRADWNTPRVFLRKRPLCLAKSFGLNSSVSLRHASRSLQGCPQAVKAGGSALCSSSASLQLDPLSEGSLYRFLALRFLKLLLGTPLRFLTLVTRGKYACSSQGVDREREATDPGAVFWGRRPIIL